MTWGGPFFSLTSVSVLSSIAYGQCPSFPGIFLKDSLGAVVLFFKAEGYFVSNIGRTTYFDQSIGGYVSIFTLLITA